MTPVVETRDLAMHPKLLMDTIKRQAGTLEKANLEGIMNAIEAGSPEVRVDLIVDGDEAILSISDDGIGIESKEELIAHFETFGTPHEKSENTYWKQFRMGRGQMFAFGKNTWRTATFKMVVDIGKNGLQYDLYENLPFVEGCQIDIELYKNPLQYYCSIDSYKEHLQKQIQFIDSKIIFNGEQINIPAKECSWDFEDENAYYLFNVGTTFSVYNLGAFTMDESSSKIGMMGIVVSKKQLKVNFARNDVQHDCEIYNSIKDVVKKNRIKKIKQKRRILTFCERIATLRDLRDGGQELRDIQGLSLIPTCQGKYISLNKIKKNKQQWMFVDGGDRFADRVMQREQALCLDDRILIDLNYTGKKSQFFVWLTRTENDWNNIWDDVAKLYIVFDDYKGGVSDKYTTLSEKKWSVLEKRVIKILQSFSCWGGRVITLGFSEQAQAWTDGSTYICLERSYLKGLYLISAYDINIHNLLMTMAHEMAHDEDTKGTHIHGPEFYENMVRILESRQAPTIHLGLFQREMNSRKLNEKIKKEEERLQKKQEKLNEKLGVIVKIAI